MKYVWLVETRDETPIITVSREVGIAVAERTIQDYFGGSIKWVEGTWSVAGHFNSSAHTIEYVTVTRTPVIQN